MLTQEEYMDVVALRAQGFTIAEIAEDLGLSPGHHLELVEGGWATTGA